MKVEKPHNEKLQAMLQEDRVEQIREHKAAIVIGLLLLTLCVSLVFFYPFDFWGARHLGPGWRCEGYSGGTRWCVEDVPVDAETGASILPGSSE